jgi:hypothetical protein
MDQPGIDFSVFKDVEESPEYVKINYRLRNTADTDTYPDGTSTFVYRPSDPPQDDNIAIEAWDDWADMILTTAQAEAIGDQILSWISANQYVGTITISSPTIMKVDGVTPYNTFYIQAGEIITTDSIDAMYISTCNVDADSGVATLTIGEPRRDFVARIRKWHGRDVRNPERWRYPKAPVWRGPGPPPPP